MTTGTLLIIHANGEKTVVRRRHSGYPSSMGVQIQEMIYYYTPQDKDTDTARFVECLQERHGGVTVEDKYDANNSDYVYVLQANAYEWEATLVKGYDDMYEDVCDKTPVALNKAVDSYVNRYGN